MNGIPSIGGTRGIFEIFIPGAFLFLNISLTYYGWILHSKFIQPGDINEIINFINKLAMPAVFIVICFGYLLGVLLRLLKTPTVDYLSGKFNECFFPGEGVCRQEFPYNRFVRKIARNRLPAPATQFISTFWMKMKDPAGGRTFYNYCKTIINSIDNNSAQEIYAAEALTRYISSMFYALLISLPIVLYSAYYISMVFSFFAVIYCISILVILKNLRFLRVKEVELVFVATMLNYQTDKWPKDKAIEENKSLDVL